MLVWRRRGRFRASRRAFHRRRNRRRDARFSWRLRPAEMRATGERREKCQATKAGAEFMSRRPSVDQLAHLSCAPLLRPRRPNDTSLPPTFKRIARASAPSPSPLSALWRTVSLRAGVRVLACQCLFVCCVLSARFLALRRCGVGRTARVGRLVSLWHRHQSRVTAAGQDLATELVAFVFSPHRYPHRRQRRPTWLSEMEYATPPPPLRSAKCTITWSKVKLSSGVPVTLRWPTLSKIFAKVTNRRNDKTGRAFSIQIPTGSLH